MRREQIKAEDYLWPNIKAYHAEAYKSAQLNYALLSLLRDDKRPPTPWWRRGLNIALCRWVDFRIWLSRLIYNWDDCY